MPIATDLAVLSAAGPHPLSAYLSQVASGQASIPDLIAVPAPAGAGTADPALDELLPTGFAGAVAALRLVGQAGETGQTLVSIAGRPVRLLLLGVGDGSARALRLAGAELARQVGPGDTAVTTVAVGVAGPGVQAFAEGALLGGYEFRLTSGGPEPLGPGLIILLTPGPSDADPTGAGSDDSGSDEVGVAVRQARLLAGAAALARDLANQPAVRKDPQWLADEAVRVNTGTPVRVRAWTETDLAASGFGGMLAVGGGSARPPRLIEMSYNPGGAAPHVVIVGKGITFDSGGLSIKHNDDMKFMKADMAGGGAVIAVMSALAGLDVRLRVTGLVAAAENMPSDTAYRPGDVITQFGGTTVEVRNTDAEGRIVLADALAYAAARLAPDYLIDIATLTGAAREALGRSHAAMYATDEPLARALLAAGEASGDLLWQLPLADGYRPLIGSDVADLANVARNGRREAGSILAALYLREFTAGLRWAHLDISGPSRLVTPEGEPTIGATGFGTRLLLHLLAGSGLAATAAPAPSPA
ncbi:MAG TPA: leucyl aminopeptidase family protein [Streptosporangiaceae bacterium]